MELKSNKIDTLLIRQLKQTANKPVTRLVLLTGFNTPPAPSQEGSQLQPVTKLIAQIFLDLFAKPNSHPIAVGIIPLCSGENSPHKQKQWGILAKETFCGRNPIRPIELK